MVQRRAAEEDAARSPQDHISARRSGAPNNEKPLIALDGALSELPLTAPVAGSGAWRIDATKPAQYRAMIRRADINDGVQISIRITDPLGRSSESLAEIHPGHILPDPELTGFVLKTSVTPAGKQLNWASATPIDPGVYSLQVTVNRPPIHIFNFNFPQPPITLQMALSDVPLDEPGPVPAGADPLRVRRMPGAGPSFKYYAFVHVPFTSIVVRLNAPDGRFAQHVQPSS